MQRSSACYILFGLVLSIVNEEAMKPIDTFLKMEKDGDYENAKKLANLINDKGNSPLEQAIIDDDLNLFDVLVNFKDIKKNHVVDLNKKDKFKDNLLTKIIKNNKVDFAEVLLKVKNNDINDIDLDGYTPLTRVIGTEKKPTFIAALLQQTDIDVNKADTYNIRPIFSAIKNLKINDNGQITNDYINELLDNPDIILSGTNGDTDSVLILLIQKIIEILSSKDIKIPIEQYYIKTIIEIITKVIQNKTTNINAQNNEGIKSI